MTTQYRVKEDPRSASPTERFVPQRKREGGDWETLLSEPGERVTEERAVRVVRDYQKKDK